MLGKCMELETKTDGGKLIIQIHLWKTKSFQHFSYWEPQLSPENFYLVLRYKVEDKK